MEKVLFIYKHLPQYRIEFFEKLKEDLSNAGIELELVYGKSRNSNVLREDEVDLSWATYIPVKSIKIGNIELIWQPCLKQIKQASMVIVQPEMKLLINYYLMIRRCFSNFKLGFWGHGRNMQGKANGFRNKLNNLLLTKCDWWFAYTKGVKKYLLAHHYPESNITVVQNAIDTEALRENYNKLNSEQIEKVKKSLGIAGNRTAIYCGAMYHKKRIDFILKAAKEIKKEIFDFNLIMLGAGIEVHKAKKAAKENSWIHYLGPKFGEERVIYFKISGLQLMPGVVGLGILDSFAMQTPIVTTQYPFHSPEIDYLDNWRNGVITENSLDKYVNVILDLIKNDKEKHLVKGCKESAMYYTVNRMVNGFGKGIKSCLFFSKNLKGFDFGTQIEDSI